MAKITPFLWFNDNAEEAMDFYATVFKNFKIVHVSRLPEGTPGPAGKVITGTMNIEGQDFMVLNAGPHFQFTPAVSFFVNCENQEEVDELWSKLSGDPKSEQCGWLKDKFGLSWQIIPRQLGELMGDKDPKKAARVMRAMMQMKKIDIAGLQKAAVAT